MSSSDPTDNVPNASLSGMIATLAPTALYAGVYVLIFLILRRSRRRWYAPRTYLGTLREEYVSHMHEIGPAIANKNQRAHCTSAKWMVQLDWSFLEDPRYLCPSTSVSRCIPVPPFPSHDRGYYVRWSLYHLACVSLPLRDTSQILIDLSCSLFPINITGGGGGVQLDMLSMSNVNKDSKGGKYKYFAHCFCGWLFFGFVLALVTRESIFYINLRQAFLLSPVYANRISSRTVLFTSVPKFYLDEARLRKVFGDSVRSIWISGDSSKVDELVEERDKVAYKLEKAEVKLLKAANGERLKAIKKGAHSEEESVVAPAGGAHADTESGSLAARWIPTKKRPTHKLGKFGLYGHKVDSINWCRERLEVLIRETEAAQASYRAGETESVGGVFIEFAHQSDAQAAYQTLSHHQALHSKYSLPVRDAKD